MDVYLIDGTYELFRYFFAVPSAKDASGQEIGAVRGVLGSVLGMIEGGTTHLGVATDHVVESFRNELVSGIQDGGGRGSGAAVAVSFAGRGVDGDGRSGVADGGV